MSKIKRHSIRFYLVSLVLLSVLTVTIGITAYGFTLARNLIEKGILQSQYSYARKLSDTTELLIQTMQKDLYKGAIKLAGSKLTLDEIREVLTSYNTNSEFNSVSFVNANNIIVLSNLDRGVTGKISVITKMSYDLTKPLVSDPYISVRGNSVIAITYPVFDLKDNYVGFLIGTLYRDKPNMITNLFSKQYFSNDSYIRVTDTTGHLLYFPDKSKMGDDVSSNSVTQKLMKGLNGSMRAVNLKGQDSLFGYSVVPSSGWGIATVSPISHINQPFYDVVKKISFFAVPLVLIVLSFALYFSVRLTRPLTQLSNYSRELTHNRESKIKLNKITAWYYEIDQLKSVVQLYVEHVEQSINYLMEKAAVDELTELVNRGSLDEALNSWIEQSKPFSFVMLDIDHFKSINDTYGHQTGDKVLKKLASIMKAEARNHDICGRYGGEEFVMILPDTNTEITVGVIDRIRLKLANEPMVENRYVTFSAGVSHFPTFATDKDKLIALTDKALYQAKRNGRNRTIVVQ